MRGKYPRTKEFVMKKLFVLTIVLVTALTVFSCKRETEVESGSPVVSATTSPDEPGWKANADKPIQFDWYIHFNWFSRQWGDSRVSKYITALTGVDVRFIVPAGSEEERLNSMIAGQALPDFITLGWWAGQIPMMIDAEMLEPLNKLAEQYDPYFFKVANAERLGWYTQKDGNVYGYPNASYTASYVNHHRKDILWPLSLSLFLQDLYQLCRAW